MRRLKSGEVRYKASAAKEAQRLAADPLPLCVYRIGDKVQVYTGCGWATGYVRFSSPDRCSVMLAKEERMVSCYDNRNVRPPEK